jgi:hypothetical protein
MARSLILPKRPRRNPSATERITGGVTLVLTAGIVALILSGGAGEGPAGLSEPPKASVGAGAGGALPLKSPAGWPRGETASYDAANVFEKINGKADIYHEYDFRELRFAGYSDPKDPSRYVDVYVYDMDRPRNAFGIYRAQRSGAERPIPGGEEACASGASAFARTGRYYVEFIGSGGDAAAEVGALVGPVIEALGDGGGPAAVPDWFPAEGRGTVRYVLKNALGIGALGDAFIANYGEEVKAIVATCQDEAAAEAAIVSAVDDFELYGTPNLLVRFESRVVGIVGESDGAKAKAFVEAILEKIGAAK